MPKQLAISGSFRARSLKSSYFSFSTKILEGGEKGISRTVNEREERGGGSGLAAANEREEGKGGPIVTWLRLLLRLRVALHLPLRHVHHPLGCSHP